MRNFLAVLSVVFLSSCATQMGSGTTANARDQVAAATAAWEAAFNSREPARVTSLYDQDAVLWGTVAKTLNTTPAAIADYFKGMPKNPTGRVAFGEQNIRVFGDFAINSGNYTFSGVQDGKPTSVSARYTLVFKQRDGKWMIIDHHSSRVP